MDGARFDSLTRTMAGGGSRRRFLSAVACLVGGAAMTRAEAACPSGQYAGSGGRCLCKTSGRPPTAGGCPCGAGQTNCNGDCVDTSRDTLNCGGCGNLCPSPDPCAVPFCLGATCQLSPAAAGTPCRAATRSCEGPSSCDGSSTTCPPNPVLGVGTLCRAAAGPCDLDESCDGQSPDCPPDLFQPDTVLCRPAAGVCEGDSYCSGTGPDCPPNLKGTYLCRALAGPCDLDEFCDGVSPDCPPDAFEPPTHLCGPSQNVCAEDSYCSGTDWGCPPNPPKPDNTPCRDGAVCCGAVCSDLGSDPSNCGACGNVCGGGQGCFAGTCCAESQLCGGVCCLNGTCATGPDNQAVCCPSGTPTCPLFSLPGFPPAGNLCCPEGEHCLAPEIIGGIGLPGFSVAPPVCCPAGTLKACFVGPNGGAVTVECCDGACGVTGLSGSTWTDFVCCPASQDICPIGFGLISLPICCAAGTVCTPVTVEGVSLPFPVSICCPPAQAGCISPTDGSQLCCPVGQVCTQTGCANP